MLGTDTKWSMMVHMVAVFSARQVLRVAGREMWADLILAVHWCGRARDWSLPWLRPTTEQCTIRRQSCGLGAYCMGMRLAFAGLMRHRAARIPVPYRIRESGQGLQEP